MYRILDCFISAETYIDPVVESYPSRLRITATEWPIRMERRIRSIYLEVEMWSRRDASHTDSSYHISFFDDIAFFYEYF